METPRSAGAAAPHPGFLKNPKFNIRPILDCVAETILPFQKDIQ